MFTFQVQVVFGLQNQKLRLYKSPDQKQELNANSTKDLFSLHGSTVYVGGATSSSPAPSNGPAPVCRYVNVELSGLSAGYGVQGTQGTVLLESPKGDFTLTFDELLQQVSRDRSNI